MKRRVLSDLFAIRGPRDYLWEVLQSLGCDDQTEEGAVIADAYQLAHRLYRGEAHGYLSCDTHYHDFAHAAETFLAMGRLLHGARRASAAIAPQDLAAGLTAAILHDAGYIRKTPEKSPHGARLHAEHEQRSMDFVCRHGEFLGLGAAALEDCQAMIRGTVMREDVNAMTFRSEIQELLVRMLSVADLLAQLSSETYLERLASLYAEDQESGSPHYRGLADCYRQAIAFDERARARMRSHLPQAEAFLIQHFAARWNTPVNLYHIAMDRQMAFLSQALARGAFDPSRHLRRWGSRRSLQAIMGYR